MRLFVSNGKGHSCIRSTMTYVHIANNMQKVESPLDVFAEGVKK